MITISSLILVLLLSGSAIAQRTTREDIFNYLVKDGPSKGNDKAPVTLIEFSDFRCSFCRKFWKDTLPSLEKKYMETGKVKFVYRHLAILGRLSTAAAQAAEWILRPELKWYGYDPEVVASVVFAAAIAGLLGARLLFVLEEWESFTQAPFEFLVSGAGFSWYGGLFAGTVAAAWIFKKHNLPLPQAADISASALALAYGIGRIGWFSRR
ncbi:MAG TPA: prolipoprotein diacylglyceryl transferase family protein [Candidatus Binatia bacterium]|jgi:hypothetical protein|nr:prolipoprotein diacylglyceryl transferase family protein [Candidatus Binatia bacterium]